MRIISGRFKGAKLVSFQAPHIRPTTDRVKETVFNKLMYSIVDAEVLDLFAGTGNLGLEALSRGAKHVVCVENHPKSLSILKQNLDKLKIQPQELQVVPMDVFKYLDRPQDIYFDVVLVDPPFTRRLADSVMQAIVASSLLKATTLIVIESSAQEFIADEYLPYKLLDRRAFGDKTLSIFSQPDIEESCP